TPPEGGLMTTEPEQATIVVGVDGASRSRTTIQVAAHEARCRGARLIAVMAYSSEHALGAPATRPVATLRTAGDDRLTAGSALHDAVVGGLGGDARRGAL